MAAHFPCNLLALRGFVLCVTQMKERNSQHDKQDVRNVICIVQMFSVTHLLL